MCIKQNSCEEAFGNVVFGDVVRGFWQRGSWLSARQRGSWLVGNVVHGSWLFGNVCKHILVASVVPDNARWRVD